MKEFFLKASHELKLLSLTVVGFNKAISQLGSNDHIY